MNQSDLLTTEEVNERRPRELVSVDKDEGRLENDEAGVKRRGGARGGEQDFR